MTLILYSDGLCAPINPGGAATYGLSVQRDGREIYSECNFIEEGAHATNNRAEMWGFIRALTYVWHHQLFHTPVIFRTDSQLVAYLIMPDPRIGRCWRAKPESGYYPFYQRALRGLAPLTQCVVQWIRREENTRADALSNDAYATHVRDHGRRCVGAAQARRAFDPAVLHPPS